uniref:Uncharacterized protein n=1 Tax=Anguilla anguilla TaxID=7936 RepID=A0A0E9TGM5_ANGAN
MRSACLYLQLHFLNVMMSQKFQVSRTNNCAYIR